MSITTIYTCDACGDRWTQGSPEAKDKQLWRIRVIADTQPFAAPERYGYHDGCLFTYWCRECTDRHKLIGHARQPEPTQTHAERIEAIIREIAGEEIENKTGAV